MNAPAAKIQETRPIVVQTLWTRIYEKWIKQVLEICNNWDNFEIGKYQCGFQKKNSTLVNLIRTKIFLMRYKRTRNKPILFTLDISKAFDSIPKSVILKAIQDKIKST